MAFRSRDVGVDLGTVNTRAWVRGRGVVLSEPTVVAVAEPGGRVVAVGAEAARTIGRAPGGLAPRRPVRAGAVADPGLTLALLRHVLHRAGAAGMVRPRVLLAIPCGATDVERRALLGAALAAGARQAMLVEQPVAAALGAGLDPSQPTAVLVVDVGGGTTDVALLASGGVVACHALRVGGERMDEDIARYVRRHKGLLLGERAAEEVKIRLGTALPERHPEALTVRGRDAATGLPRSAQLTAAEVHAALADTLAQIAAAVHRVLEQAPPELAADLVDRGIVLTGGGSLLRDLDLYLAQRLGVPVHRADDPLAAVVLGTGRCLEQLRRWEALVVGRAP